MCVILIIIMLIIVMLILLLILLCIDNINVIININNVCVIM